MLFATLHDVDFLMRRLTLFFSVRTAQLFRHLSVPLLVISLFLVAAPVSSADADSASTNKHKLISKKQLKSSAKLCEDKWPKMAKPARALTDRCMQYWLFVHNYKRPVSFEKAGSTFSLDPYPVSSTRRTAEYYRKMGAHVKAAFPGDESWPVRRALEFFRGCAASYTSYFDMNLDLIDDFKIIIAGKPYKANGLANAANPNSVWFLRNATYARHGRKFKHPDLNHYFYGTWKRPKQVNALFPLKINKNFKESMLTKIDRANIRAIEKSAAADPE